MCIRDRLKQPQNSPLSVGEQIAVIYAGINGYLDEIAVADIKSYCASLLNYINVSEKSYITALNEGKDYEFTATVEEKLKEAIIASKELFSATKKA